MITHKVSVKRVKSVYCVALQAAVWGERWAERLDLGQNQEESSDSDTSPADRSRRIDVLRFMKDREALVSSITG